MPAAVRSFPLLVWMLGSLIGCIVDGTLDGTGGGRMRIRYRLVSVANFEQMKARLQSPDVTVTDAVMAPDKWATFDLAFTDVRKLSTAPSLSGAAITLVDDPGGGRTLTVAMQSGAKLPAPYVQYLGGELRLVLAFPEPVVRSNATAVDGRTATWVRSLDEMQGTAPVVFTATFAAAPPG
jgi:hypothetical protein